jgi:hypothetical protein
VTVSISGRVVGEARENRCMVEFMSPGMSDGGQAQYNVGRRAALANARCTSERQARTL